MTLIVGLLLQSSPAIAGRAETQTAKQEARVSDEGKLAPDGEKLNSDATILYEDETLRGEFEKHFVRADGSNVAVSYGEPVHVRQPDGKWVDIDNSLSVQENRIQNTGFSAYQVSFASERDDTKMVQLNDEGYELSWSMEAAVQPRRMRTADVPQTVQAVPDIRIENAVAQTAEKPELEAIQKTASEVLYPHVLNDAADLRYTVMTGKVMEELIIRDGSVCTRLVQRFNTNGLTAVQREDGGVDFQEDDGRPIFTLISLTLYDAADDMTKDIAVTVEQEENVCTVTYEPDREWMEAENRIMPLSLWTSVRTNTVRSNFKDTYVYEDDVSASNHINEEKMWVGFKSEPNVSGLKNHHALWKCVNLPTIVGNITGASFYLQCTDGTSTSRPFSLCRINEDWDDVNVRYHTQPDDNCIVDNAPRQSNNQVVFTNQYVTDTVSGWYSGTYRNFGFKIRYTNESRDNPDYNVFYTSDHSRTEYMPYLEISYIGTDPPLGELFQTAPVDGLYCYIRNAEGYYLQANGMTATNTNWRPNETVYYNYADWGE